MQWQAGPVFELGALRWRPAKVLLFLLDRGLAEVRSAMNALAQPSGLSPPWACLAQGLALSPAAWWAQPWAQQP